MKSVREFLSEAGSKVEFLVKLVFALAAGAFWPVLLLWVLYKLIAPLFGDDPLGRIAGLLSYGVVIAAIVVVWAALLVAAFWLWERSAWFRALVIFAFAAPVILGVITSCSDHGSTTCRPSRYIEC